MKDRQEKHNGTEEFVEKMGLLFETQGIARSAGRIAAWLMVSPEPHTLDEIAETLKMSKASASTSTRFLEQVDMIEKVTRPGDRKVYYRFADGVWARAVRRSLAKLEAFVKIAQEGQALVGRDNAVAQQRLKEMEEFYRATLRSLADWMDELERHSERGGPCDPTGKTF